MNSSTRSIRAELRLRVAILALVSALVAVMVLLAADRAWADAPPAPADDAEARRLYEEGLRHYRLGEYDQAIADLDASYQRVQAPALLYDLAQVYRLKHDCARALRLYRDYLASGPSESNRARAQARIADADRCVASETVDPTIDEKKLRPPPPPPAPMLTAPTPAPPGDQPGASIAVAIAAPPARAQLSWSTRFVHSRAALTLGAATVVLASSFSYFAWQTAHSSNQVSDVYRSGTEWDSAAAGAQDRGRRSEKLEIASGVGALLTGAAVAWLTLRH